VPGRFGSLAVAVRPLQLDRCGSDAPGAVSVLTFESLLARIWIETMVLCR